MNKLMKTILAILTLATSASAIPFLDVAFAQNPDKWDVHLTMTAREIEPTATDCRFYLDGIYAGGYPDGWSGDMTGGYGFVNPDFDPSL